MVRGSSIIVVHLYSVEREVKSGRAISWGSGAPYGRWRL